MILPDTSVWIYHIHHRDEDLAELLSLKQVLIHPFVIGEIALGNMQNYDLVIESLLTLPSAPSVMDGDVRYMISHHAIMGSGIGYVDAHLLASAKLMENTQLWTRDKRLRRVAEAMGVASVLP